MSGRKLRPRPIPGASRRDVIRAQVRREDLLRSALREFLDELNGAVPIELLATAARAEDFSTATQNSLLAQAQARIDAVLQHWHRVLAELLIQPEQQRVHKTAWDGLSFEALRRITNAQLGDLIRQLSIQQMETVRRQLAALVQHGATEDILLAIGDTTGLTAQQSTAVRNTYETVLRESGPGAAVRAADRHRERLTEYRANLIARTEATRYLGSVVHARGEQMGGNVVKAWVSARDVNVDAGNRINGPCVVGDDGLWYPMHEPFANGLMQPPAHPGCRCLIEIQQLDDVAAA
jgi:uncharacterized protein with gpF-like domain